MTLQLLKFQQASEWVLARCTVRTTKDAVLSALQVLAAAVEAMRADCEFEGVFPDSDLVVLVSRDLAPGESPQSRAPIPPTVEAQALRAIGEAITRAMRDTGKKILTIRLDAFCEIVVYPPAVRETVLLGTNTILLDA